jgi:hypothetical protein
MATAMLALAAATGVLLRFGLYLGMPAWGANFNAVRHAHSHLMYFGWVTLGLMALIWHYLPDYSGVPAPRGARGQLAVTAGLALLSFPAFWANGYGLTPVAGRELPLGAMLSGFNGLAWFWFVWLYARATRRLVARPLPVQLWDWGLALMVVASLGALGVAATAALHSSSIFLQQFFLHLFLDLFAVGWFMLGLLGVIWAGLARKGALPSQLPAMSLAVALTPTFVLGMSPAAVTSGMFWLAALANGVAVALLARHMIALWGRRADLPLLIRFALAALVLHLLATLAVLIPGVWRWSAGTQLRIYVLHTFLLGWVSSGLLASLVIAVGQMRARRWRVVTWGWMAGVAAMLIALAGLGLAVLIPVPPLVWLRLAAWSSLLPTAAAVCAALFLLPLGSRRRRALDASTSAQTPALKTPG